MPLTKHIRVSYDPEAQVWWAESDNLPGLVSEGATLDEVCARAVAVAPELLALNRISEPGERVTLDFFHERVVERAATQIA